MRSGETLPETSENAKNSYPVAAFALVREFVEQVLVPHAAAEIDGRRPVDWAAIEALIIDCRSLEQAIGRAVVVADQMSRGVFEDTQQCTEIVKQESPVTGGESPLVARDEDPFFAFSMTDAVPDFGDESRYRTKVARKVARVLGVQRTMVTPAVAP